VHPWRAPQARPRRVGDDDPQHLAPPRSRPRRGARALPGANSSAPQADSILASDFFTVYSLWGTTLYVLFFIELSSRRVHVAGCTARPDSVWVTQQACNLSMGLEDRGTPVRFLIHDRDAKFGGGFDVVFRADGVDIIRTPAKAPRANAFAERWVKTVKTECLDWILIVGPRHLQAILRDYARALQLWPPAPRA
jgi:putative transposase